MANRSRIKGTSWESACVSALQAAHWPYAERRALAGSLDKGDIAGVPAVMIECKSEQRIALAQYANEVAAQKANAKAAVGVAWVKRARKATANDGYVVMSGDQFMQLLHEAGY